MKKLYLLCWYLLLYLAIKLHKMAIILTKHIYFVADIFMYVGWTKACLGQTTQNCTESVVVIGLPTVTFRDSYS